LRRVNSTQQHEKLDEIKQELKAENLVKAIAAKLKQPLEKIYNEITAKVFIEYSYLYLCFKAVVNKEVDLLKLGLAPPLAEELKTAILEKFRPPKFIIKGEIVLHTYASDGVEKVKSVLHQVELVSPMIHLAYLGAGRFQLTIEDIAYKPAEKNLAAVERVLNEFNDKLSTATFEREKTA